MAMRTGQEYMVNYLRDVCLAGTSDYTFNGGTYWTDNQLADILNKTASVSSHINAIPISQETQGTLYYYQYQIPGAWFEDETSGTPYFHIYDGMGTAIGTADFTLEPKTGMLTFDDDRGGSAVTLNITRYNINQAAADLWRRKAAHISEVSYDISLDGHKLSRSQRVSLYMSMAREYEAQSGFSEIPVVRSDIMGVNL